ncbi:Protein translocase subunit SecA [Durusdinium trenchii]|uniref:Protein translocase subunit SecA n=1 Tax=Durusdinium trenchii TaxID=1381693 RepID=A0ABP0HCK4_9DINO
MSRERVKGLIPNRETRRRQVSGPPSGRAESGWKGGRTAEAGRPFACRHGQRGEIKKSESYKVEKEAKGITMDKGAAARSMNLARLSLNVRQVLEAREGLGELALASFSELKDTFARSGLLTLGDQLMWAQACSEFELLEDELAGEVYIGLVGRMEPQAAKAPPETNLEDMDIERFEERQREAQKLFESAQEDPNFVQTLAAFSNEPELFLKELKAASQEQGWTREDVKKMKETYAMMGINLEVMLQEMQASADALPPAQRDLVAYMQQMLTDPDSVLQKAEDKAEKVDA